MSDKCKKCKKDAKNGATFVEGGIAYKFCQECSHKIEESGKSMPIHHFMNPDKKETKVMKNIREAKEARARGESLWR